MYKFEARKGAITDETGTIMIDEETKIITVTESYVTYLRVSKDWHLKNASDNDIRALLTNTMPENGHDQREIPLTLHDFSDAHKIKFDKENI